MMRKISTFQKWAIGIVIGLTFIRWAFDGIPFLREPEPDPPPEVIVKQVPPKKRYEEFQLSMDTDWRFYLELRLNLDQRIKSGEVIHYGNLEVTSDPPSAEVLVDSYVPLGKTPYKKNKLPVGEYRVTVRRECFFEKVRMVNVEADKANVAHFKLEPIPYAHLTVESEPPGAMVRVIGLEREYRPGMALVPGGYYVYVWHGKYGLKRLYAALGDQQDLTLKADFTARPGGIKVEAKQKDATVYVDGREAGRAPLTISGLLPGPHKVQVWKSLFKPTATTVTVKPGKDVEVSIDLDPVEYFINSLGMEFVKIPAGKFMMGFRDRPEVVAAKNQIDPKFDIYDSYPRHLVKITRPFFMQTTEVTQKQWLEITGDKPHIFLQPVDLPVYVDYMPKILAFIHELNQREKGNFKYRLPTEAEWEYACRAGTTSPYYTGETINTNQAAYTVKWKPSVKPRELSEALPVKSFSPNPWGLFDMHGNVSEICSDFYDGKFYAFSHIQDPKSIGIPENNYVVRGGSWLDGQFACDSALRFFAIITSPDHESLYNGFRLVAERIE